MSSPTDPQPGLDRLHVHRAIRRSGLSRYAAWVAGLAAIALVVVFLAQAGLYAYLAPKLSLPQPHVENPGQVSSTDSTLTGIDNNGQPYEITATRGVQDAELANIYNLDKMTAIFHRPTGNPYHVTSDTARYDSKAKTADLAGSVVIKQEGRLTARMDKAHVDMGAKSLTSGVPVTVDLPQGVIHANGLKITDDGAHILFLNGVKAHFETTSDTQGANP